MSGLGSGGVDDNDAQAGRIVTHALTGEGFDASEDGTGRGTPLVVPISSDALRAGDAKTPSPDAEGRVRLRGSVGVFVKAQKAHDPDDCERWEEADATPAVTSHSTTSATAVTDDVAVRRLTPTECCRLQGFPDDWFGEPNEPPDGPRYAGLGDAVTVNVAEWFGRKLMEAGVPQGTADAQEKR